MQSSISAWLNLAAVRRQRKDLDGAFSCDPAGPDARCHGISPALLMSATMLESRGSCRACGARLRRRARQCAARRSVSTRRRCGRCSAGRAVLRRLYAPARRAHPGPGCRRRGRCTSRRSAAGIDAFIDTTLRVRKRFRQEPLEYYYPGLPAIEFYERERVSRGSRNSKPRRDGHRAGAASTSSARTQPGFAPYIHYDEHLPLDQWTRAQPLAALERLSLLARTAGAIERQLRRAARARSTAVSQACRRLDIPRRSGRRRCTRCSRRSTRIPPHTGVANFQAMIVHLPLIVPGGLRLPRRRRGAGSGGSGEGWVFRRHDRARGVERQRRRAPHSHLRRVESLVCRSRSARRLPAIIAATDAFNGTTPSAHVRSGGRARTPCS